MPDRETKLKGDDARIPDFLSEWWRALSFRRWAEFSPTQFRIGREPDANP